MTTPELLEKASKRPWKWEDVSGAGIQLYGIVPFKANCVEFTLKDAAQPIYTFIAYEQWIQFAPEKWEEMQKANAALIVAAVNSFEMLRNEIRVAIAAIPEIQSRGDYYAQGIVAQLTKALALADGGQL